MPQAVYEYLIDSAGKDYPFVAHYSDDRLNRLIVDALITSFEPSEKFTLNRISVNTTGIARLIIKDSSSTTVLDTNSIDVTTATPVWTGQYVTYEYYNRITSFCLKVIIDRSILSEFSPSVDWTSIDLDFVNRVNNIAPTGVERLFVSPGYLLNEKIKLISGYNVKLTEVAQDPALLSNTIKPITKLQIDVVPGYGKGRYQLNNSSSNCEDISYLRKINNVGPDAYGNFILDSTDCGWVTVPASSNALEIHDECGECYDCGDVIDAYKKLTIVSNKAAAVRQDLEAIIASYGQKINLVNQLKAALDLTTAVIFINQTDFTAFDIIVRVQAGLSTITKVKIKIKFTVTSTNPSHTISASVTPFSVYKKLPGFASSQLQDPAFSFDGNNELEYEYTVPVTASASSPSGQSVAQPGTWMYIFWNSTIQRTDYASSTENTEINAHYEIYLNGSSMAARVGDKVISITTSKPT